MMKCLGMVLIAAAAIAFLVPRLQVNLPEGVSMPTLPTDIREVCYCWLGFLFRSFPKKEVINSFMIGGHVAALMQSGNNYAPSTFVSTSVVR